MQQWKATTEICHYQNQAEKSAIMKAKYWKNISINRVLFNCSLKGDFVEIENVFLLQNFVLK